MVCANLREISRLRIFVRGVNAKKKLFSWADLYLYLLGPNFRNSSLSLTWSPTPRTGFLMTRLNKL